MRDSILVLDYDHALSGLIARTLRGQQVRCALLSPDTGLEEVRALSPRGLILAAGHEEENDAFDDALMTLGVPVLALGGVVPALCRRYGGQVTNVLPKSEEITLGLQNSALFENMTGGERVLHDLRCLNLPDSLASIATATERCIGFQHGSLPVYAVQYPIERNDPDAVQLLQNFARLICGAEPTWNEETIIERAVAEIRAAAGDGRVLCAVSGGVDSAACAKLAHRAVGDRLTCVFIDTGLFRDGEPKRVIGSFMETLGLVVAYIDAKDAFLHALDGLRALPDKERVVSALLKQVLYKELAPDVSAIVLGTNYNDALYGAPQAADTVRQETDVRIVEPICELFKNEVRRLAETLALPGSIVERQPFPVSGLAGRVMGEVTQERLDVLRAADAFLVEEIRAGGHERKLWQYYALLTENIADSDGFAVILRASQAAQGGAYAARLPYDLLERVVERCLKEIPQVKRVIYDLTPSRHYALWEG